MSPRIGIHEKAARHLKRAGAPAVREELPPEAGAETAADPGPDSFGSATS